MEAVVEILVIVVWAAISVLGGLAIALVPLVLGLAVLVVSVRRRGKLTKERNKRLVAELGLTLESGGYSGTLDGSNVRMARRSTGSGKHRSDYTDFVALTGIEGLVFSSRDALFAPRAVDVGDPDFDRDFRVHCGPDALGWLSADVRAAAMALTCQGAVRHKDGAFIVTLSGQSHSAERCEWFLRAVGAVARKMQAQGRLQDLLQDPLGGVRWRALEALALTDRSEALEASRRIRSDGDADPGVRLVVAMVLRDETAAVKEISDAAVDPELRARMTEGLNGTTRCDAVAALVLDSRLWVRAIGAAQGAEGPEMSAALLGLFGSGGMVHAAAETGRYETACERLARCLGKGPGPGVNEALFRLLTLPDDGVRLAAMQSLAVVGTVSDIAAMRTFEETLGMFDGSLKLTLGQAIARIQARAGGSTGQLSIVDEAPDVGAVSLARPQRSESTS